MFTRFLSSGPLTHTMVVLHLQAALGHGEAHRREGDDWKLLCPALAHAE